MVSSKCEVFRKKFHSVLIDDDVEGLVRLYDEYPDDVMKLWMGVYAVNKAKRCFIAVFSGEIFQQPPTLEGRQELLHLVAYHFPDPDVIDIMFEQGAIKYLNIRYRVSGCHDGPYIPLEFVVEGLRSMHHLQHLHSWSAGDSIFKLIILLCQWDVKHRLDAARRFAFNTHLINEIAWAFLKTGKLMQLAALLLVSQKEVMAPYDTGMTIRQRLEIFIDELSAEADLDDQHVLYKYMLKEACILIDVFEKAGDSLGLYCSSMCKQVTPSKVLADVAKILSKAGFVLQSRDLDLRDCYRDCLELWKPNIWKLSNYTPRPKNAHISHSYYYTGIQTSCTTPGKLPCRHWDPMIACIKSREGLKLASSVSLPRSFSTAACQIDQTCAASSYPLKRLANVAMKLKKGIRFM